MFQFKDKNSTKIYSLNEIDEIACKFWGKSYDTKHYATPAQGGPNWFDMLGHAIEDLQYLSKKYNDKIYYIKSINGGTEPHFEMHRVASMLTFQFTNYASNAEELFTSVEDIKPYIELCFHLKSKDIIGVGLGW